MQKAFSILILFLLSKIVLGQKQENYIHEGNEFFKNGQLQNAIISYNRVTDPKLMYTALLNKGTALYKMKKYEEALHTYQQISTSPNANITIRSGAYYNIGVVLSNQKKIEESIEAYKNALRLNWKDREARENLQKALSELKKNGGGGETKPNPASASKLNKNQAQQHLQRLEEKERATQNKLTNKKTQFSGSNGKDW